MNDAQLLRALGATIAELRSDQLLTQCDLGRAAGISQSTISLIENGMMSPAITSLNRLAAALGTTVDRLLTAALLTAARADVDDWLDNPTPAPLEHR